MGDRPVRVGRPRHAFQAVEHVPLADEEGADVGELVAVVRVQGWGGVVLVVGEDLHRHQTGDRSGDLVPGGRVDLFRSVVVQGDSALGDVEAVGWWDGEGILIPESADDCNPGGNS